MKSDTSVVNGSRREFFKEVGRLFTSGIRKIVDKGLLSSEDIEVAEEPSTIVEARIARLDITKCLAWQNANCQLCYLACPLRDRAITMRDLKPVIEMSVCDGCAMCEAACRTVNDLCAIDMAAVPAEKELNLSVKEVSK